MKRRLVLLLVILITLVNLVPLHDAPVEPKREWTIEDSKAYAKDAVYAWQLNQWKCLDQLWTRESNWRPEAYNKIKVMGKNAGGIPQILGLSPDVPATQQIDRGVAYIIYRYGTFCNAWKFYQKKGWY